MFAEKLAVRDEVIERAAYIYRKAVERGVTRGRSIIQISAAALYAACSIDSSPKTRSKSSSDAGPGRLNRKPCNEVTPASRNNRY